MKRHFFAVLSLGLLWLVGCGGTLEIDMAPVNEGESPTAKANLADVPSHIPLTTYSDSQHGFILPVPQNAVVDELQNEANYVKGFARPDQGFSVLVQTHADLAPELREPGALLRQLLSAETLPGTLTPLSNGSLTGGWVALPPDRGQQCAETVAVSAAFVNHNRAFSLLIRSDAPDRCNAATLAETHAILDGFRYDASAVAMMTPTPVPAPPVEVAYLREDNVWLWTEEEGRFTLFEEQGAEGPLRLHPAGQWVAFLREGDLWVVSRDGDDERPLTGEGTFADFRLPDGAVAEPVSFEPYQFEWIPGTELLLFNTRIVLEGPGLVLSNDLWQVNAASGDVSNLLPAGAGGAFVLAPDGSQLALVRPDVIEVADVDGANRRQLLSYEPVLTYSEYQFYADPVWSQEGSALRVAIPPADPLADPEQLTTIWHLPLSGGPARRLGEIAVAPTPPGGKVAIAPDLGSVAFLQAGAGGDGLFQLMLATLGSDVGQPIRYAEDVEEFAGWSPDGDAFLFSPAFENAPRLLLGRPGSSPQPVGNPAVAVVSGQWTGLLEQDLVYLQQAAEGWEIWLDRAQGESQVVDVVSGAPPAFDTR